MEFILICIKPRALQVLTHFIFATIPWDRYPIIPTSDMQKLGLSGACLVIMNLYIFKISVHLPHCTVILRMQRPYCFLAPWSKPTLWLRIYHKWLKDKGMKWWGVRCPRMPSALVLPYDCCPPLEFRCYPHERVWYSSPCWVQKWWGRVQSNHSASPGLVKMSRSICLQKLKKNHDHVKPQISRHLWKILWPALRGEMGSFVTGYSCPYLMKFDDTWH